MAKRFDQRNTSSGERSRERQSPAEVGGPKVWLVAVLFGIAIGAVYFPALRLPLIFDDRSAIVGNESIVKLWPLIGQDGQPGPLNPPPNIPTSPRPLVNFSLALNYCLGGADPFGYHVFSVVVHYLTALLLWALVRRTLLLPYFDERFEASAGWLAMAIAGLWALHPLNTEAVIYATQRSELMMAFFYVATLYCSVRYWTAQPAHGSLEHAGVATANGRTSRAIWFSLATISCLAGMASKEVMVSAPLMVLLFERTFVAGSFAKALRQSSALYIGLAATWLLLLVVSLRAPYGASAGFAAGIPFTDWWLTQSEVFLMYLKLAIWPWPLLIHYELPYRTALGQAWMFLLPVVALGAITLVLLWRNHPAGFLCTAIFVILAPTSLIPIPLEMAAERRMYLPLAAVVILIIIGGWQLLRRVAGVANPKGKQSLAPSVWASVAAGVVLVSVVCLGVSAKRLASYKSEVVLWQEVLKHQPNNAIAHNNLGLLFTMAGRIPESIAELQTALAIKPDYLYALNNLGNAYFLTNRLPEAVEAFRAAVRVDPNCFPANSNLGIQLMRMGRIEEAIAPLQQAVRLKPANAQAHISLGGALMSIGQSDASAREFEAALAVEPDNITALINSSVPLASVGRIPEAIENLRHALRLQPSNSDAHTNLGVYLSQAGNNMEAMEHFQAVLAQNPNNADIHFRYANSLTSAGRAAEAISHLQEAVALNPDFADALFSLAQAYRLAGRTQDALATAQRAISVSERSNQPATAARIREWLKQDSTATKPTGDAPTKYP